jgi:MoaA/NifB/PqqE/SkfB family radical SAM enzyme
MRLADIIRQCQEAGVSEVELHPDGSIARMKFADRRPKREAKKLSRVEQLKKDQEERNPRKNAMDLAVKVASDLRGDVQ